MGYFKERQIGTWDSLTKHPEDVPAWEEENLFHAEQEFVWRLQHDDYSDEQVAEAQAAMIAARKRTQG